MISYIFIISQISGWCKLLPARPTISTRGRVFPRGFFSCTRAAGDFYARTGIFAGILSPVPARPTISARGRVFPREFFSCTRAAGDFCARAGISAGILLLYPRGLTFPTAGGYFRAVSFPVPARPAISARGRVFPRGFFPCTRAASDFCARTGISARFSHFWNNFN